MIIDLPKHFLYATTMHNYAEVDEGILNIKGRIRYRDIMYNLTYALKDRKHCMYCGKEITKEERTLDHMYPRCSGGPTITNNLAVSCYECNPKKQEMNVEEYRQFCTLQRKDQEEFLQKVYKKQLASRSQQKWGIPMEWVQYQNLLDIISNPESIESYKGEGRESIHNMFQEYGLLKRPLVVDSQNHLLEGYPIYAYAKSRGLVEVPIIRLGNVIWVL